MFGLGEAMLGFLRRQVGLRTDVADANGSLHAKVKDIKADTDSIQTSINKGILSKKAYATNTLQLSIDEETHGDSETEWHMDRSIFVNVPGLIRVSFSLRRNYEGTVYARIYIDGEPVGTQRETTSGSPVTFTEDFVLPKPAEVQIWAKSSSGGSLYNHYISNFRIRFDFANDEYIGQVVK